MRTDGAHREPVRLESSLWRSAMPGRYDAWAMQAPTMSEAAGRFWTVLFGGVTAIGLVFGGIYTVIQYFQTYALQAATAELEAKKPFYSKHLDLCSEASVAAATIATSKDPEKKKAAAEDFWRLYWGPLGMVEEREVEGAMVPFCNCLHGTCEKTPSILSLHLPHSCRTEISRHFALSLPELSKKLAPDTTDKD